MLRQRGMSQQAVPGSHNMMMSGLRTFALAFLLGGWSAVAAGAEPAPSLASLNSDLARLTLRQAEIFFGGRGLHRRPAVRAYRPLTILSKWLANFARLSVHAVPHSRYEWRALRDR